MLSLFEGIKLGMNEDSKQSLNSDDTRGAFHLAIHSLTLFLPNQMLVSLIGDTFFRLRTSADRQREWTCRKAEARRLLSAKSLIRSHYCLSKWSPFGQSLLKFASTFRQPPVCDVNNKTSGLDKHLFIWFCGKSLVLICLSAWQFRRVCVHQFWSCRHLLVLLPTSAASIAIVHFRKSLYTSSTNRCNAVSYLSSSSTWY